MAAVFRPIMQICAIRSNGSYNQRLEVAVPHPRVRPETVSRMSGKLDAVTDNSFRLWPG